MSVDMNVAEEIAFQGIEKQVETQIPEMDARDRCDACGSRSYVAVILKDSPKENKRLDFCKHHWERHEGVLLDSIVDIRDERSKLDVPKENAVHA
jgi:hypothetical protein